MSSKFLDFLLGYEKSNTNFKNSVPAKAEKRFTEWLIGGVGNSYAKKLFESKGIKFASNLSKMFACLSLRSYGIAMLFFGVTTLLLNFADYYFSLLPSSPTVDLIVGAAFALISLPFLFSDMSLTDAFQKWRLTDFLFFDVLCLRRIRKDEGAKTKNRLYIPIIVGIIFATVGFFVPMTVFLLCLLCAIFVILTLSAPEFAFILTLFCLPVFPLLPMPTLILSMIIGMTLLSFIIKVLLGKRRFHFEQYDMLLIVFMLFILISGIFNGSFQKGVSTTVIISVYFLSSNLLVNRRIAENAVKALLASSVPTAIYAIAFYFIAPEIHSEWLDPIFASGIDARAVATFGNPNIYAVYLLTVSIFSASFVFERSASTKQKALYSIPLVLNVFALVITWTRGAWLALGLSLLVFGIIKSRRCPKFLLIPLLALPLLPNILPESIIKRFLSIFNLSDSSIASRLSIWRSSVRMFIDNIFVGVGVGEDAFSSEFLKFAEDSVSAPHSHNLFLEIGCELGIFALITFLLLLTVRIRHRASYARYVKNSSVDRICTTAGTALFALLVFGMTDYIFYNSQMMALFFIMFGIGSATLRISKNDYDDARISHFGANSETKAELNVTVTQSDV